MQGFHPRNYNIDTMQRDQLHHMEMPPYSKSTPPMSPNSGKFQVIFMFKCDGRSSNLTRKCIFAISLRKNKQKH